MVGSERLEEARRALVEWLGMSFMEPDAGRTDWEAHRRALRDVAATADEVIAAFEARRVALRGDELHTLARAISALIAEAAALLHAAREAEAPRLRRWAFEVGRSERLAAAQEAPDAHAALIHAEWLLRIGRAREARAAARRLVDEAPGALAQPARRLVEQPRPLRRPPMMGRLLGCGWALLGAREAWPDGSHVATRWLTLLYLPLIPQGAYRVEPRGAASPRFIGAVPLRASLRWWGQLVPAALVLALLVVFDGLVSRETLQRDLEAGLEAIAAAGRETPEAYAALIDRQGDEVDVSPAVERAVELHLAAPPAAPSAEAAVALIHAIKRCRGVPRFGAGRSRAMVAERALAWSEAIGEADRLQALLLAVEAAALGAPRAEALRRQHQRALADSLVERFPIGALRVYVGVIEEPGVAEIVDGLLGGLLETPSVLLELSVGIEALEASSVAARLTHLEAARARLDETAAYAQKVKRRALLRRGDVEGLRAALDAQPDDQTLAARLAERLAEEGSINAGYGVLKALGPEERLAREARLTLARLHAWSGRVDSAEALLERELRAALPDFKRAQRAFEDAVAVVEAGARARLRSGEAPQALQEAARGKSVSERRRLEREWISELLEADAEVKRQRPRLEATRQTIPIALELSELLMQRAVAQVGQARAATLARAEAALLAIQREGDEGLQHLLGLGRLRHQQGRAEEGERALEAVLAREIPSLTAEVAYAYSGLGDAARARAIAEPLFAQTLGAPRREAALLMATLTPDDEEALRWLKAADSTNPTVGLLKVLVGVKALVARGRYEDASRALAAAAAAWAQVEAPPLVVAQHVALIHLERFDLMGGPGDLTDAGLLLALGRRVGGGAGLVSSLAELQTRRLISRALQRLIPPRDWSKLWLSGADQGGVLRMLLEGPMRAEAQAAIRASRMAPRLQGLLRRLQGLRPSAPSAYRADARWAAALGDVERLKILERVTRRAVKQLDVETERQALEAWRRGGMDTLARLSLDSALRDDRLLRGAPRAARAVAAALNAEDLLARARLERDTLKAYDFAKEALGRALEAHRGWPAVGAAPLAEALLLVMLLDAAEESPDLAMACAMGGLRAHLGALLRRALSMPKARAALESHPHLGRLNALYGQLAPRLEAWMIAGLTGDPKRLEAAKAAFEEPALRLKIRIERALSPHLEWPKIALDVLAAGPG